jgi:Uma2 family endonuclease
MPATLQRPKTLAEVLARLGDIPLHRIRWQPLPGTATEKDLLRVIDDENRSCELVDGILVEKAMGLKESFLAQELSYRLTHFNRAKKLGAVAGEQGTVQLEKGLIRIPDVGFYLVTSLPGGKIPYEPIPELSPDLAVEILSKSNTVKEMERKREEYFRAGTKLLWIIDPASETVQIFQGPEDEGRVVGVHDPLDGGDILPGFRVTLAELLAELPPMAEPTPPPTKPSPPPKKKRRS